MSQDAEILKKRSFRQNIHHVMRLVKLIHSLDHSFYAWNFASVIMKAVITYGALLLSSFVVNGLSNGTDYAYILKVTIGTAILLSGAASIDYFIDKHLEMAMNVMETQYMALQQEKIMNLDYALIDSPRLKEIRERMRLERNWGAGIYSMFWQEKDFLIHLLKLVVALILLFPQLQYFKGKVQIEKHRYSSVFVYNYGWCGIYYPLLKQDVFIYVFPYSNKRGKEMECSIYLGLCMAWKI